MKICMWNDPKSSKCKKVSAMKKTKDRYAFLLDGPVTVKPWMNTKTMKEFYRPVLNGITVTDGDKPFSEFKTVNLAHKEGERLRALIVAELGLVPAQ
jgi:hypothetical protein